MTVDEALDAAREFEETTGVKVSFFQEKVETDDKKLVDKIISTTPEPGTKVETQVTVTLFVGFIPE
jgi:beta-lactam-binding protein with PASTA domain